MGDRIQFIASVADSIGYSGLLIAIVVGGLVAAAVVSALTGELYASDLRRAAVERSVRALPPAGHS
ncbi:hypothetical protein MMF94_04955 [Pseudonocardia alaniniphila]|uniref:Uncharacterized protein n=2 Tax=Pseudonocardia alaniniphila TaxID=75291 RepID=A0ABS9T929_9PSEU|nr:hypothetical protein [Pseudonocardia alaniniphila]MCH6165024.1 hypothetical protein [Pseudonocardia alaniniphila]